MAEFGPGGSLVVDLPPVEGVAIVGSSHSGEAYDESIDAEIDEYVDSGEEDVVEVPVTLCQEGDETLPLVAESPGS